MLNIVLAFKSTVMSFTVIDSYKDILKRKDKKEVSYTKYLNIYNWF